MAKLKTDYSKTIIYKLVHKNDFNNENIYVGSTTDFARRKYFHSWNCCNEKSRCSHLKVYQIINANGGWSEWNMVQLQKYPCSDKREAQAQEEYWRSLLNAGLNTYRPFRTLEEKIEYEKNYYIKNRAEKLEQQKNYYIENRAEISEKQKNYYIENRAEKLEQQKNYYIENRAEINKKSECGCGGKFTKRNKLKHLNTKKHIAYINGNKIEELI
jgi:hypothetical protein